MCQLIEKFSLFDELFIDIRQDKFSWEDKRAARFQVILTFALSSMSDYEELNLFMI